MGKFIDEVAKINQNENHKYKISEERNNVKNALYKYFNREFLKCDDYDDVDIKYNYFMQDRTKNQVCYHAHDFGTHVTMEFVDTTYYKELDKVYKIFKKRRDIAINTDAVKDCELQTFEIVFDSKKQMMLEKTLKRHAELNAPLYEEEKNGYLIKHYKVLDSNSNPYDLKIYYNKKNDKIKEDVLNVMLTYRDLNKDKFLDGIPVQTNPIATIIVTLIAIPLALLFVGYKLLALIVFIILMILIWLT